MTGEQSNKLAMFGSVEGLLKATTETSGIAGLPARLTALTTKLAELRKLASTQEQPTEAQTASRDQMLDALVDTTLEIAGIVGTYAHVQGNPALSRLVDVQRSDFTVARLVQRPLLSQRVHDAALGVLPALADLGLTAETLTAFQHQIDAMHANINQPRQTIVDKKAATEQLVEAFSDVEALLTEQIDRLVLPLRKTAPEFYARYRSMRLTVNAPGARSDPAATPPATNATTAHAAAAPAAMAASPMPEQKAA